MNPFDRHPNEDFGEYVRRLCKIIVGTKFDAGDVLISRKRTLILLSEAMEVLVQEAFRDGKKHGKAIGRRDAIEDLRRAVGDLD